MKEKDINDKPNLADVRELANDLLKCITDHPNAIKFNPHYAKKIETLEKEIRSDYTKYSEGRRIN